LDYLRLLKNAGFTAVNSDGVHIYMEDPSCILRSFETFLDYAWVAVTFIAGLLLFGWAIAYIRGSKIDGLLTNLRNLTLIFGILAAVKPAIGLIWGGDVFARGCKVIQVSVGDVQKILDARNSKLKTRDENDLYEDFDIYDSGAGDALGMPNELHYAAAPLYGAGDAESIPVSVIGGDRMYPLDQSPSGAAVSGKEVIYTDANGNWFKKTNGSTAWRNNNPGNITCGGGLMFGAIACNGRFLVFPDEDTGMRAIVSLLKTPKYQNARPRECPSVPTGSLGAAICRWAPPSDNNNTGNYQRTMERKTGIPLNTPLSQLNDVQMQRVSQTIRAFEGWNVGTETRL
jgi:hypothetical protein